MRVGVVVLVHLQADLLVDSQVGLLVHLLVEGEVLELVLLDLVLWVVWV